MSGLRRWAHEVLVPAAKCDRVGHEPREHSEQSYRYPAKGWGDVADRVQEIVTNCARCGAELDREDRMRTGLTSLSMPAAMWDDLKAKGRVRI